MQDFVESTVITPAMKTDHAAIELVLKDSHPSIKGRGYWKMNVSLLDDENYLNELRNNFPEWKTTGINNLSDKRAIWDWLKYKIRNHAIYYSKQKARERNAREKLLQTTYEEAAKRYEEDQSTINQNLLNEAKEILACEQAHLLFRAASPARRMAPFSSPASLARGCGSAALDTLPKQQVSLLAG